MACEHKRLKSVNCVIMCADCGAVLPAQCAAGGPRSPTGADAPPPHCDGEAGATKKRAARKKKVAADDGGEG